jgi:DNA-binding NtrC family response regulator
VVSHYFMKPKSILVVDDDVALLEALKVLLERNGHQVTRACAGREAAEAIDNESFDLLLTDVLFPGRHSIEALIALGKRKSSVRIIGMSGTGKFLPDYYLILTRRLGVQTILPKPVSEEQLMAAIEKVFSRELNPRDADKAMS